MIPRVYDLSLIHWDRKSKGPGIQPSNTRFESSFPFRYLNLDYFWNQNILERVELVMWLTVSIQVHFKYFIRFQFSF